MHIDDLKMYLIQISYKENCKNQGYSSIIVTNNQLSTNEIYIKNKMHNSSFSTQNN